MADKASTRSDVNAIAMSRDADAVLAEHTAAIKALGKLVIDEIIEIGARLAICKQVIEDTGGGYAGWLSWIDREFKWDEKTARNYLNVHAFVEKKPETFRICL